MRLYEREAIAAAASGRNSGVLQHPMDEPLVALYEASLALYAELGHGFELPAEPARRARALRGRRPRCGATAPRSPRASRSSRRSGSRARRSRTPSPGSPTACAAYRLETGRPVPPAAAAARWAERAREAGAELLIGEAVEASSTAGA